MNNPFKSHQHDIDENDQVQGKAAYFTTFVPYILILILSIRGFSLQVSVIMIISLQCFNFSAQLNVTIRDIEEIVGKKPLLTSQSQS